jgi:methyl-accepting chemotaxis protein
MLALPPRGDQLARRWVTVGIALYVLLVGVFLIGLLDAEAGRLQSLTTLVGLGSPRNWSVFFLVVGGFALTIYAITTVVADVGAIQKEEDDVEWIDSHGRAGAALVLAPESEREKLFEQGARSIPTGPNVKIETLIDDRVRRAHSARLRGGSAIAVEELRIIAERRTARWGSFARYASSLLLLLAVLGTFAGVKTALPGLIDAVSETDPGSATATGDPVPTIAAPLRAVSDAFGGNALALIGAIAIGLMAQGIGVGRRNLLERLELVSAEHVYGDEGAQSADPLRAAIHALNQTAQEIQSSSGALLGIEGGLELLGSEFKSAIRSLDDRLTQLLQHHESGLYERTSGVLEELQARVSALASVVDANTRLYAGLVDQIGERTAESREAIGELRSANQSIARALEGTIRLGDASASASSRVTESSQVLVDSTLQVAQQVEAINRAVTALAPMFEHVNSSFELTASRVKDMNDQAIHSWTGVGQHVGKKIDELSLTVGDRGGTTAGLSREAESLLRQIANHTAPARRAGPPAWQLALLPLIGVLAGAATLFLLSRFGLIP